MSCDIWFRPAPAVRPRLRSVRTWKHPSSPPRSPPPFLSCPRAVDPLRSNRAQSIRALPRQDIPPSAVRPETERRTQSIRASARPAVEHRPPSDLAPSAVDPPRLGGRESVARPGAERSRSVPRLDESVRRAPVAVRHETRAQSIHGAELVVASASSRGWRSITFSMRRGLVDLAWRGRSSATFSARRSAARTELSDTRQAWVVRNQGSRIQPAQVYCTSPPSNVVLD